MRTNPTARRDPGYRDVSERTQGSIDILSLVGQAVFGKAGGEGGDKDKPKDSATPKP